MDTSLWLTPLILLPGVAMLIMSTSARYAQIHSEIHHLLDENNSNAGKIIKHLLIRAKLFRNALVSLYSSAAFLALAGLVGCLSLIWKEFSLESSVLFLIGLGILALLLATVELIRESILSLEIIRSHHRDFEQRNKTK